MYVKKITEYDIIVSNDLDDLIEEVDRLIDRIDNSWEPHGNLVTFKNGSKIKFMQPMIAFSYTNI